MPAQPFVNLRSICFMTDDDWGTHDSSVHTLVLKHFTTYRPIPPTYQSIPIEILDFQSPDKFLQGQIENSITVIFSPVSSTVYFPSKPVLGCSIR